MFDRSDLRRRIAAQVEIDEGGCWIWRGYVKPNGYGTLAIARHPYYVHRLSYEAHVGPIPEGLEIDHLCRVRACCNPDHLEPVTHAENGRRGMAGVLKTHCNNGHLYDAANTYLYRGQWRRCRQCDRERQRRNPIRGKRAHLRDVRS